MDTPVGPVTLGSSDRGLSFLHFGTNVQPGWVLDEPANQPFTAQVSEYFQGSRMTFDLPLDMNGTPFKMSVWRELLQIPYGQTRSYGDIAKSLGKPGAARAVGMANHDNPIAIVVPCHRVVGHDGSLTGYAGGLDLKHKLLSIERKTLFT
jgi:methylated-DNA-[protein]-cysteine S-methyltransferase